MLLQHITFQDKQKLLFPTFFYQNGKKKPNIYLRHSCFFLDSVCKCKSCLPPDEAGGASYGEERVRMELGGEEEPTGKFLVVFSMVLNFSFRGGNVIFVSSVGGYQPMQVK